MPKIFLTDTTLRDGSHTVSHQFTAEDTKKIVSALDNAGIDMIELGHGDGLAGSSINYGFSKCDDYTLIKAAASVIKNAKLAVLLLPGIGTVEALEEAKKHGITAVRVATHVTEADIAEQHIRAAKDMGLFTVGFLMMAHMADADKVVIEDTNTPYIKKKLTDNSYKVSIGGVLDDDERHIASKLSNAVLEGYGLIITTGGVGAEDKDKTVEAILRIDANASTPYIVKSKRGSGRHLKDGVRIAVGKSGQALIVALPGPNDEVIIGMEELLKGLNSGLDKEGIATLIANALSKKLIQKKQYSHH